MEKTDGETGRVAEQFHWSFHLRLCTVSLESRSDGTRIIHASAEPGEWARRQKLPQDTRFSIGLVETKEPQQEGQQIGFIEFGHVGAPFSYHYWAANCTVSGAIIADLFQSIGLNPSGERTISFGTPKIPFPVTWEIENTVPIDSLEIKSVLFEHPAAELQD